MANHSTINFPYESMDQAIQDGFKKLDGKEGAFRFMKNGYKGTIWRKGSNERRQDRIKAALEFVKEHEKKTGKKEDRQLGRI